MDLPKEAAELLGCRLTEKNLLGATFLFIGIMRKDLIPFFEMDDDFVYWVDSDGLLGAMGCEHNVEAFQ